MNKHLKRDPWVKSTRCKQARRLLLTLNYFSFLFTVWSLVCEPVFVLQTELNTLMSHQRHGMLLWPTSTLKDRVNPKLPFLFYPYQINIWSFGVSIYHLLLRKASVWLLTLRVFLHALPVTAAHWAIWTACLHCGRQVGWLKTAKGAQCHGPVMNSRV